LLLSRELAVRHPNLLAAGRPAPSEGELTDEAVHVHHLPLVRPVRPASDARSFVAVRRLLRATRPRVLHTHMAKAGTVGRLAALSVRTGRPRLVHTYHGHVLDGYFGRATQRTFIEVERRLARRTDVLIAISPEVRDELLDLGIGRADQYRVISFGLELDPFRLVDGPRGDLRAQLGLDPHIPLVGVVGRLVPIKAVDVLIKAMTRLPDVHLAVLGDGDQRSELEALATKLDIAHRVHFTGWWRDIASAMSDFDIVALSSNNEGTPVALIEALAAARPVVATDVGGVRHVVHDGDNGLLVPAGDPDALARALDTLLKDPGLRRRFGLAGRDRAVTQFGSARFVAEMAQLYDELRHLRSVSTRS
jgi:glycosyltransferase involved in cell wall biosynthesis